MIEIKHLQKIVGQQTALDVPALVVQAGESAAVVAPAGSGKEVLFDLLIGKARPSAGTIRLAGADPADRAAFSRNVGVLFEEDALYKRQSPQANLTLHCLLHGLPASRAREVLEQIGMADQSNANLEKLPAGLLRRLAFGRAILHGPQVLLLMAPFARCDEASITLLSSLISRQAGEGAAILILADDTAHLTSLCDAVYTLNQGCLSEALQPGVAQQSSLPFRIPVRLEDKVILVNPADILYVEAEEGRACLHTTESRLPVHLSLGELEARLSRSGFFRAHRAYLVNLQHIKEVIPYTRNSFSLRLNDKKSTEIPLSKSAASELRELLGY